MKKIFLLIISLIALFLIDQKFDLKQYYFKKKEEINKEKIEKQIILSEESTIIKVVEKTIPSVVTVGVNTIISKDDFIEIDPFDFFSPFRKIPGKKEKIEKNIGSGFIVSEDGLIITNKHVVADPNANYQILTYDKKKYPVEKIYRDPLNDLAILKVKGSGFKPLELGESKNLKLGQLVIAIGTPLGEFTNTVTSGIISGLGRGITAGSPFEGFVERLDNVIQTDAAINPGNSGGPLLNSKGQVIGVNTAIASEGQNIGFAIPVDVVKDLLEKFKRNGMNFNRPFLGIRYKMIDKETAILNDIVEGAYVIEVINGSPAEKAGIQEEDIIIEFEGKKLKTNNNQELAKLISEKKPGQTVSLKIWRNKEIKTINVTLEEIKE